MNSTYAFFGDEHGLLIFPEAKYQLPLDSIVTLETPHCDLTVNLHDYLHIAQRDVGRCLEDRWARSPLTLISGSLSEMASPETTTR